MFKKINAATKSPFFFVILLAVTCFAFIFLSTFESKPALAGTKCNVHEEFQLRCVNTENTPEKKIKVKNIGDKSAFFDVVKYVSTCGQAGTKYYNSPRYEKAPGEFEEFTIESTGGGECKELFVVNCLTRGDENIKCPDFLQTQIQ